MLAHEVDARTLVLTRLRGRPAERLTPAVARQVGALLARFHEIRFDAFGYIGTHGLVRAHGTNLDYMRFQFEKKLRELDELGGDAELRRRIERHVAEREELFAGCDTAVLCHDDCHGANVLLERGTVSGIVDWENAVAGDPLLDLAKTFCFTRERSEALLEGLAGGYGTLREGWRGALDLYVVYHLLELWDWFASIGEREPLGGIAAALEERARL